MSDWVGVDGGVERGFYTGEVVVGGVVEKGVVGGS